MKENFDEKFPPKADPPQAEKKEKGKEVRPSEKPEHHKKFIEIEMFLISHFKDREKEWVEHHAETYRNWFDQKPEHIEKKYEEDPEKFAVEFQAKLDAADDEGD